MGVPSIRGKATWETAVRTQGEWFAESVQQGRAKDSHGLGGTLNIARTFVLLALGVLSASCKEADDAPVECTAGGNATLSSVDADGFDAIVFGEIHGNVQTPQLFFDAVCKFASNSSPPLVGVEMPASSIKAVRDSVERGRQDVFRDVFWARSRDGRSSAANLELIERLVRLESQGFIRLVGFDTRVTGREDFGASSLSALTSEEQATGGKGKWILLTGRGHSRYGNDPLSLSYALVQSGRSTSVVDLTLATGTTWACVMGECKVQQTGSSECESSSMPRDPGPGTRLQVTNLCIDSATASAPAADSATASGE